MITWNIESSEYFTESDEWDGHFKITGNGSLSYTAMIDYVKWIRDTFPNQPMQILSIGRDINITESLKGIPFEQITFSPQSKIKVLPKGCFQQCSQTVYIWLPPQLTSIPDDCFSECGLLQSVDVPDTVTSIGQNAFRACGSYLEIEISPSVTRIGTAAFLDCEKLTRVIFTSNSSLTSIGSSVFSGTSLTHMEFPMSLQQVEGSTTFQFVPNLQSISMHRNIWIAIHQSLGIYVNRFVYFGEEGIVYVNRTDDPQDLLPDRSGEGQKRFSSYIPIKTLPVETLPVETLPVKTPPSSLPAINGTVWILIGAVVVALVIGVIFWKSRRKPGKKEKVSLINSIGVDTESENVKIPLEKKEVPGPPTQDRSRTDAIVETENVRIPIAPAIYPNSENEEVRLRFL